MTPNYCQPATGPNYTYYLHMVLRSQLLAVKVVTKSYLSVMLLWEDDKKNTEITKRLDIIAILSSSFVFCVEHQKNVHEITKAFDIETFHGAIFRCASCAPSIISRRKTEISFKDGIDCACGAVRAWRAASGGPVLRNSDTGCKLSANSGPADCSQLFLCQGKGLVH